MNNGIVNIAKKLEDALDAIKEMSKVLEEMNKAVYGIEKIALDMDVRNVEHNNKIDTKIRDFEINFDNFSRMIGAHLGIIESKMKESDIPEI